SGIKRNLLIKCARSRYHFPNRPTIQAGAGLRGLCQMSISQQVLECFEFSSHSFDRVFQNAKTRCLVGQRDRNYQIATRRECTIDGVRKVAGGDDQEVAVPISELVELYKSSIGRPVNVYRICIKA